MKIIILYFSLAVILGCSLEVDFKNLSKIASREFETISTPAINSENKDDGEIFLRGNCSLGMSSFTILEPIDLAQKVNCRSDGTWEVRLDLSNQPEGTVVLNTDVADSKQGGVVKFEILKDTVLPSAPGNITDGEFFNSSIRSPYILFTPGSDSGSGVSHHEVRLVRLSDSQVVEDWRPFVSGEYFGDLALAPNTWYRAEVRSVDKVGNKSVTVIGDGWLVDVTAPTKPMNLSYPISYKSLKKTPIISWDSSSDVNGSGIDRYEVRIYKKSEEPVSDWRGLESGKFISDLQLIENTEYYLKVKAYDRAGNSSIEVNGSFWKALQPDCPEEFGDFILVPSLAGYAESDFCVAKYEMKKVNINEVVTAFSQPLLSPWDGWGQEGGSNSCGHCNARLACTRLGPNYKLISNAQWQTIARNIELTSSNWSAGTIGAGAINIGRGIYDGGSKEASNSDLDPCYNTNSPMCEDGTHSHWTKKRTHQLSNGEVIWDFGGNAGERIDDITNNEFGGGMNFRISEITESSHPVIGKIGEVEGRVKDIYGPSGNYGYLNENPWGGLGMAHLKYGPGKTTSNINRGEFGIFGVSQDPASNGSGFRCTYVP